MKNVTGAAGKAHDSPVRTMVWSHNDMWMVTGDHAGYVKYWQSNMNNVKMFQAHKEAIRGLRALGCMITGAGVKSLGAIKNHRYSLSLAFILPSMHLSGYNHCHA
uniref:Uncharacterized protein n=1 Tax=Timema poppense TaxID=170557 RepID=A0A7R9CSB9_TIMPO|nr:unnamed protein product [Timema poppensis]